MDTTAWRVFTFPGAGRLGDVGVAEIDAETGEMLTAPESFEAEIMQRLETEIKPRMPKDRKTPVREAPPEYIVRDVPPAPKLVLPNDEEEQE